MKRLKQWYAGLSHARRFALNMVLLGLMCSVLWARADYPLPQGLQFRRLERAHLLPRSEIVYRDDQNVVGVSEGWAISAWLSGSTPGTWRFCRYPLNEDGPTLIPLRSERSHSHDTLEQEAVIAVGVPEAARIKVTLAFARGEWSRNVVIDGKELDGGVWYCPFRFPVQEAAENEDLSRTMMDFYEGKTQTPYTLQAYDSSGSALERHSGRLPLGEQN